MWAVDSRHLLIFAVAQRRVGAVGVCFQDRRNFETHTKRQKHHIQYFPSLPSKVKGTTGTNAERCDEGLV